MKTRTIKNALKSAGLVGLLILAGGCGSRYEETLFNESIEDNAVILTAPSSLPQIYRLEIEKPDGHKYILSGGRFCVKGDLRSVTEISNNTTNTYNRPCETTRQIEPTYHSYIVKIKEKIAERETSNIERIKQELGAQE